MVFCLGVRRDYGIQARIYEKFVDAIIDNLLGDCAHVGVLYHYYVDVTVLFYNTQSTTRGVRTLSGVGSQFIRAPNSLIPSSVCGVQNIAVITAGVIPPNVLATCRSCCCPEKQWHAMDW